HAQRNVVLACEGELPRRLDAEQREIGVDPVVAPGQRPERPEHRALDPPLQRPPSPEEGFVMGEVDGAVATQGCLELAPPANEIGSSTLDPVHVDPGCRDEPRDPGRRPIAEYGHDPAADLAAGSFERGLFPSGGRRTGATGVAEPAPTLERAHLAPRHRPAY